MDGHRNKRKGKGAGKAPAGANYLFCCRQHSGCERRIRVRETIGQVDGVWTCTMVTISQIGEHCGEQRRPMDRSQRAQTGGSAVSRAAGAPRVAMVPRVKTLAMQLFAMAAGPKRVLMALSLQAYQLPAGAQRTAALAALPTQSLRT